MSKILQRRHNAEPQKRNAVLLEESIGELALYFGVSFIAAKLRIIEFALIKELESISLQRKHLL